MEEWLCDKSRDELADALNSVGVKAEIAERGRVEEVVENFGSPRSLGIIDIYEGPIRWINILRTDRTDNRPLNGGLHWVSQMKGLPQVASRSKSRVKSKGFKGGL